MKSVEEFLGANKDSFPVNVILAVLGAVNLYQLGDFSAEKKKIEIYPPLGDVFPKK